MNLDQDPRVGKAGAYRYCRRCGTLFCQAREASWHFGEGRYRHGGKLGQECNRIPCSGIPRGCPRQNPAPGSRKPDMAHQEVSG